MLDTSATPFRVSMEKEKPEPTADLKPNHVILWHNLLIE